MFEDSVGTGEVKVPVFSNVPTKVLSDQIKGPHSSPGQWLWGESSLNFCHSQSEVLPPVLSCVLLGAVKDEDLFKSCEHSLSHLALDC